jgi:tRNA (Thr-GGU) A37 N-methylase
MNIEQVPIYDIKPYENNAKKHTEAQIEVNYGYR